MEVVDKSILKQLSSLYTEYESEEKRVAELEKEIEAMPPRNREVTDTVTKGKRGKKPLGICTIHGNEDNSLINKKRENLRTRKAQKNMHLAQIEGLIVKAEEYIYTIQESEIRNILLYYCIDRKSWKEVAEAMGEGYTAEMCKQKYSRFMRVK